MTEGTRSRIAPTPSGFLHIGNACNFLLTEHLVRRDGGRLLLRIDDLDAPRIRREYISDLFDSLRWLGIQPDEGPANDADFAGNYSQQKRLGQYRQLLGKLERTGKLFACRCSRADVLRNNRDGQYPGTCRDKGIPLTDTNVAWRFRTGEEDAGSWQDGICGPQRVSLHQHLRDFVVRRRDGLPAYHIASLSDDASYGINLIVRGQDLLHSTAAQILLAAELGLSDFTSCRFYHHPLLKDHAGAKLSKSAGSDSLKAAREAGVSGDAMRKMAADWYADFL